MTRPRSSCAEVARIHGPHHYVVAEPSGSTPGIMAWCEGVTPEEALEAQAMTTLQLEGFTTEVLPSDQSE